MFYKLVVVVDVLPLAEPVIVPVVLIQFPLTLNPVMFTDRSEDPSTVIDKFFKILSKRILLS